MSHGNTIVKHYYNVRKTADSFPAFLFSNGFLPGKKNILLNLKKKNIPIAIGVILNQPHRTIGFCQREESIYYNIAFYAVGRKSIGGIRKCA